MNLYPCNDRALENPFLRSYDEMTAAMVYGDEEDEEECSFQYVPWYYD